MPALTLRSAWGASEQIRRGSPSYAPELRFSVVHHTAASNSYTRAQSAAIVRAIQLYHVRGNGWNDIGYNFLVDKYGQVLDGRFGGAERNVVGAHAEGFNTGSVGVALLGTYASAQPSTAALTAIANLLAWRLDVGHVDLLARLSWISGGNARFPLARRFRSLPSPVIDTGPTTCPGNALYRQLPTIACRVAEIGLPGCTTRSSRAAGRAVRFRARLSTVWPWSVTVTDEAGAPVSVGRGEGTIVEWTWTRRRIRPRATRTRSRRSGHASCHRPRRTARRR